MFCTKCGKPLKDGVKFCTSCGCPVAEVTERSSVDDVAAGADGEKAEASSVGKPSTDIGASGEQGTSASVSLGRKIRAPLFLAVAAALVAILGVGAFALSGGGEGASGIVTFSYGANVPAKVLPTARIVMYDSSGNAMRDYDVTVTDAEGKQSVYHVDGDSFTPEDAGVPSGEATFSAKDPKTGDDCELPVTVDKDDPESASDIEAKPEQPNPSDDVLTDEAAIDGKRQAAYALYLDKVNELIEGWGEPAAGVSAYGDTIELVNGLGMVELTDFDGDGIEELIVAHHAPSDDEAAYTFEVWTVENGKLMSLGSAFHNSADAGEVVLSLHHRADESGTVVLTGMNRLYSDDIVYEEYFLGSADNGHVGLTTFTSGTPGDPSDSGSWYRIDGAEVSEEEYRKEREALFEFEDEVAFEEDFFLRAAPEIYEGLEKGTVGIGGAKHTVNYLMPSRVVERAKATINVLERGAEGDFSQASAGKASATEDDEMGADDAKTMSDEIAEGDKVKGIVGTLSGVTGQSGSWRTIEFDDGPLTVISSPAGLPVEARNVLLAMPGSLEPYEYDGSLGDGTPIVSGSGTIDVVDGTVYLHVDKLEQAS